MITVKLDASRVKAMFSGIENALNDLRPIWPQVHDVFIDFVKQNFSTQGGYTGQSWVPLNPAYAKWKQREYAGQGILHLRERLYPSLTDKNHPSHVALEGPTFGEYGTSLAYAKAHQFGRPEINLPARVVIPKPTKVEAERVVDILLAFVFRTARRAFRRR